MEDKWEKSIAIQEFYTQPKIIHQQVKKMQELESISHSPTERNTLERILFKLKRNGEKILKWRKTEPSKWVSMRKREIMENMDDSEWIYLRPSEKMLLTI